MVAIILTEALFGASSSCTDFNGVFGSNYLRCPCFSSRFSLSDTPFSEISLGNKRVKKQKRILGVGILSCSLGNGIVDKEELEFKPSFDEYLKAMESLKEKKKSDSVIRRKKGEEEKGKFGKSVVKKCVESSDVVEKREGVGAVEEKGSGGKLEFRKVVIEKRESISKAKHVDEMDRAAFKSMDDDAYDKPRVTKADMEQRIQRLAKCLNGADIDMPEWMFSKMMRSAQIRFSDHSILRIIQILGRLGNWRRVLQVIEWLCSRERFKSHKLRYIYTAALDALGKARRPVEALNLFRAMQEHISSYPDLVAYHCIAVTLGQAGHMKELFDVIDTMQSPPKKKFKTNIIEKFDPRLEPDVVIYNAVLNACGRRKSWEGAFWVLQQLKLRDQQPSVTTYGLVMEVMFECGKYNLVHDFFKKMQKSCIPNALTYKVLVSTLWKEGKTDEAILAVEDMERRGIVGTASLYYDLARCLCSAGRCEEALMQMEKICKVASKPLVVTYTGLLQACLDSGDVQSGVYIFNQMNQFCSPNLVTYNIMLKAYLDNGMFEEARQLFFKLLDNGNHISSKLDSKDKVLPDVYTFNLMLDAYAAEKKWDDLGFTYSRMLKYGYHFNPKRHIQIVLDSCSAGKVELLEATWKDLAQADRVPPVPLVKEMFRVQLGRGNFSTALACLADYPSSESQAFSARFWMKFFLENSDRLSDGTLFRLLQEVSPVVATKDSRILNNLMASCKEFLRTRSAKLDRVHSETALVC
ncbi:pentatricopeptide repeat-containing protein At1g30610, chloroplastic [Nicotiana tabacum]|uniref:Pentatricopeptide repeat-containing protein At1g30610, chloroplastic n=1 Tax=Nicotiana tabacum TaxID=4097 RepID=A0A1S4B2V0_TOBAC|nr:pentatricopeptide repeat-containing protein At1g30610, chloroplastic [Nicotiana tomentosiformis]XP_016483270.1 PREDICTED: pentatricopeptide repeat-containing protein At1g30610, chloroplastic-like [Nicotiana tabacum]